MSSSPLPNDKRRTFTREQKLALVEQYNAAPSKTKWRKQHRLASSLISRWKRGVGLDAPGGRRKRSGRKRRNGADHERDIAALAVLNAPAPRIERVPHHVNGTTSDDVDARLGVVLGATIAEIIKRLRP
jgi:transposase-like protein